MAKQRSIDVYRVYVQKEDRRTDTPTVLPRLLLVDAKHYGKEHEIAPRMLAVDFPGFAFCYLERVGHGNVPS